MKPAGVRLWASSLIVAVLVSSVVGVGGLLDMEGSPFSEKQAIDTFAIGEDADKPVSISSLMHKDIVLGQQTSYNQALSTNTDKLTSGPSVVQVTRMSETREVMKERSITSKVVSIQDQGLEDVVFDLGGPYGGPLCFEGNCTINFEITVSDSTLLFFRWDFNNDGVWDTAWLTERTYTKTYFDNYYGMVRAEGWNGVSTNTTILTGTNLDETVYVDWLLNPANVGWRLRAKEDLDIIQLGYWQDIWGYIWVDLRLWDFNTMTLLTSCTLYTRPSNTPRSWVWCTLNFPVHITASSEYMISLHKWSDGSPDFTGVDNLGFSWDKVEYLGYYYANGGSPRFPAFYHSGYIIPKVDLRWRKIIIKPATIQDTAFLDVRNVPPYVFGITSTPSQADEGSSIDLSASFNDPGTEDTWRYRWSYGDGTSSNWKTVNKYSGGARVLVYHTIADEIRNFKEALSETCGYFCTTIDEYDFGPLGHNEHLSLSDFLDYDVIYVTMNYFPQVSMAVLGDMLADYQDQKGSFGSGGVVVDGGALSNMETGIKGRWRTDIYNPVPFASITYGSREIGAIYVPGHEVFNGVVNLTATMVLDELSITPNATRLADWDDGKVLAAIKLNPVIRNGARTVAIPFLAPWYQCTGDCVLIVANSIRWASNQSDPVQFSMPIQLSPVSHVYREDHPTTTSPGDNFTVTVEVEDDDHLQFFSRSTSIYSQNFSTDCSNGIFPPNWTNIPSHGWRCEDSKELGSLAAVYWYYYNDFSTSLLIGPTLNLSAYNSMIVEWRQFWRANRFYGGHQNGYVEVSIDGGLTYPTLLKKFYFMHPSYEVADYTIETSSTSNVTRLRFRIESWRQWGWHVDNIRLSGVESFTAWGQGNCSANLTVNNVPPLIVGGPSSDTAYVGIPYNFTGLILSDPALMLPTEWFAYRFDFGDGSPAEWIYKGTLAPPKQDILVLHSLCISGDVCTTCASLANLLYDLDVVGSVTFFNFFGLLRAPDLSYMMNFDVIMFASEWAYISNPTFDQVRIDIGDNLADYLDAHAGGVVTLMNAFDISGIGDYWSILGRYTNEEYGPFEKGNYTYSSAYLGNVHYPDHPVIEGVTNVSSDIIHTGDINSTSNGIRLASWNDNGAAVGINDYMNDSRRSCAIGAYAGGFTGIDASRLMRQCIGWVIGGIPTPKIPIVNHTWSSTGSYIVDISVIDDDMGWTWDSNNGVPVLDPRYAQTIEHRYIQIDVVP